MISLVDMYSREKVHGLPQLVEVRDFEVAQS